jgi:hypothetical protein
MFDLRPHTEFLALFLRHFVCQSLTSALNPLCHVTIAQCALALVHARLLLAISLLFLLEFLVLAFDQRDQRVASSLQLERRARFDETI